MRRQASATTFIGSFPAELPAVGLPEVAFAGRSNVGKSSALNALIGSRKAARVSSRPGRTQTINLFRVGTAACFADLPGYGYAKVPEYVLEKWKPMVEAYLGEREALRMVVLLIDGRHEAQEMDLDLHESLRAFKLPVLVVATKVDKLPKHARKPQLAALREAFDLPEGQPVPFSAKTGEGCEMVWDCIEAACRGGA
jgi:GTP-binding protein